MLFHQSFDLHDLAIVGFLVVLEGVLSIDNALVLGLLAKRLPRHQQARALTLGLVGAFVFRFISIATASLLLRFMVVKLIGGGYLFYVAGKYFWEQFRASGDDEESDTVARPDAATTPSEATSSEAEPSLASSAAKVPSFWWTVLVIELTDIAFAVDSILAAMALAGSRSDKLWVVITGGMLGVILMRYAATVFIRLLEKFPRFETAAYLLVAVIGIKLVLDWGFNKPGEPAVLDFHDWRSITFWTFWVVMLLCFCVGFIPKRNPTNSQVAASQ